MTTSTTGPDTQLEEHRGALTGYCYRMLGSAFEAEDAVQDTMIRAWKSIDRFDGRSSLKTWLFSIATNVCLDALAARKRRALPMDLQAEPSRAAGPLAPPLVETTWVEPIADVRVVTTDGDPAEVIAMRESIRLAFVAALQHLPPKQRAVLILRDVLRLKAAEVADLLDQSVASINSALQRARVSLESKDVNPDSTPKQPAASDGALLTRYVDAFERYDIDAFVSLLHEDATQSMPPYPMWLRGTDEIATWMLGPGAPCRGSRLIPIMINGVQGFAQYRPSGPGGRHEPWNLHVPEIVDGRIANITYFLDKKLFPLFGLPQHPDD
ncbi:MAG: sigma-70 family RNA polymerase sigma factor [Actinomycetota bacterium]